MRPFSRTLLVSLTFISCAVFAPLWAEPSEGAAELPRGVILTVKSPSLKELSDKILEVAREVAPGPEVESMPFMLGAMLGDPMLQGVVPGENVGFAMVKTEGGYLPVVFARLTEESPYRRSLPGYGMAVADYEDWTFATVAPFEPDGLGGKRDALIEWVRLPRERDVEVRINAPEVSRFILEKEADIRRPLQELNAPEYEEALWAIVQTLAGEFKILSSVGLGLDLDAQSITHYAHLEADGDSALGRFLSADHTASPEVAEWIDAGHPVVFLGRIHPGALLDYFRYFSAKAEVVGGEALRTLFEPIEEMTALFAAHSEGNNAGYFGFTGFAPAMVQISDSSFDEENLRQWLQVTRDFMEQPALKGLGEVESGTELIEGERTAAGVPVFTLRTRIDADLPAEGDGADFGGYGIEDQEVHYARVGEYLVTAYDYAELERIVTAVLGNERPPESAAGFFGRESGVAGRLRLDGGALLSIAAGFMAPGREMETDLPPAMGELRVGERGARGKLVIPVELLAGVYRELQAMTEEMANGPVPFEDDWEADEDRDIEDGPAE